MTGFFEALLKFFSEFTWRKLFAVIVVCTVGIVVLSLYERYTSSFRLSRLQRATELLLTVHELESMASSPGSELERAKRELIVQAVQAIEQKPLTLDILPTTIKLSIDDAWHFGAGAALWILLAAFQLPKIREKKERSAFFGLVLMSLVSGFFAIFTPAVWWPWFHLLIYPFLFITVMMLALMPVVYVASKRAARSRIQKNAA